MLKKHGRTSEYSQGGVAAIDATIKVDYGGFTLSIQDCIVTGIVSYPGDSGSLCVDVSSNAAVGLLFAGGVMGGYGVTILCRMEHVARLLNIAVPMPDPIQRSLWLDISKWQGDIDFAKMKSRGVRGVIMKVCEGASYVDPRFAEYYAAARNAGLLVGGYVFVDPQYSAQAHYANLVSVVGNREFDCPVAMDCERSGVSNQVITACIQQLGDLLTNWGGRRPMIYTSVGFWDANVNRWSGWKEYPLWIAYWSTTAVYPLVPVDWKDATGKVLTDKVVMWQWRVFKNGGPYFGVSSTDIDMDSTFPAFEALLDPEPPPPPPDMVTLTISIEGQGSVSPGSGLYPKGSAVTLQATPAQGWVFEEWILPDSETETNPITLTLNDNLGIWAMFGEASGGIAEYTHNKGRVMIDGLRIRSGPNVAATITGRLVTGDTVEILGTTKDASGNTWARIGWNQWCCMIYGAQIYVRYVLEGE